MGCCALVRTQSWKGRTLGHESEQLETFTPCPVCGISFTPNDTHRQLAAHIEHCTRLQPLLQSLSPQVSPAATMHNRRESLLPLSFSDKSQHFRVQCSKARTPWFKATRAFGVNREAVVKDSVRNLQGAGTEDMRKEFDVTFEGESGLDVGGVMKEWMYTVTCELFKRETGLFLRADTEEVRYRINPQSPSSALPLFTLTGKVLGKALFDGVPLNCPLIPPLYRELSGQKTKLSDLKFADKSLYESLSYIKSQNILEMTISNFAVQMTNGETVELKPGGKEVNITEDNKKEYVKLRKRWEARGSVWRQLEALAEGFWEVVPVDWVGYFAPEELELLMCGKPTIDVSDWEQSTEYRGDFHHQHPVVLWFWCVLRSLSQGELSLFLLFSIGSARLPTDGFSALTNTRGEYARFTLQSVDFDPRAPYPRAHTCFHRVDLPLYNSKEDLHASLMTAISNSVGFGLE